MEEVSTGSCVVQPSPEVQANSREASPALSIEVVYEMRYGGPPPSPSPSEALVAETLRPAEAVNDPRCRVCQKRHPLRYCRRFKHMTVEKRLRAVVQYRYCARCLASTHNTAQCKSEKRCAICRADHHSMLHLDLERRRRGTQPSRTDRRHNRRSLWSASSQQRLQPLTSPGLATITVLPTCLVRLCFGSRRILVRALIDPCSVTSKIRSQLVPNLPVSRVGGTDYGEITVTSLHDATIRLTVSVRLTDRFFVVTPTRDLSEVTRAEFASFKLADPDFHKRSGIDLVLGANVYALVIKPTLVQRRGLPLAQDTIFGWVLSRPCLN